MKKFLLTLASLSLLVSCAQGIIIDPDYGETNNTAETVGVDSITTYSAVLFGKANLGNTVASDLKLGFQYSKSAGILPSNSVTLFVDDADADYNFRSSISGLDSETKYFFRAFIRQNGQDTYGQTKEFTTANFSISDHSLSFSQSGGSKTTTISIQDWKVSGCPGWVVLNPVDGTSSKRITIEVGKNTGYNRVGYIVITSGEQSDVITISQKGSLGRTTMLVYFAGFNNLSLELSKNERDLMGGFLPTKEEDDNVVLVFSHYSKPNIFSRSAAPVMTRYYRDSCGEVQSEVVKSWPAGANSSSPEMINDVISFTTSTFATDHVGVVFSSHATGWLPCVSFHSDVIWSKTNKCLNNQHLFPETKVFGAMGSDLSTAGIHEMADAIPGHLDYIIFDACSMGGVEVAYAFKNICDYIVFSPTEELADGMVYQTMVSHILQESCNLSAICEDHFNYYNSFSDDRRSATISLVDCSKIDRLAQVCRKLISKYRERVDNVDPKTVQSYFYNQGYHYFYDFQDIFVQSGVGPELSELESALSSTVIFKAATPSFFNIHINRYSGLSMYLPADGSVEIDEYYKKSIRWNQATNLVADSSVSLSSDML